MGPQLGGKVNNNMMNSGQDFTISIIDGILCTGDLGANNYHQNNIKMKNGLSKSQPNPR